MTRLESHLSDIRKEMRSLSTVCDHDMAEHLGMSVKEYRAILSGEKDMTLDFIVAFAEANHLGFTIRLFRDL